MANRELELFAAKAGIAVAIVMMALAVIVLLTCAVLLVAGFHGRGVLAAIGAALIAFGLGWVERKERIKG